MKKIIGVWLLLAITLPAAAVEEGQTEYVGGTVQSIKEGTVGRLDLTSETSMAFVSSGGQLMISFRSIESYQYAHEVARHLGVLPAIGVGLIRKRQQRHFIRIAYRDESHVSQVVILEVPKHMPATLLAVLHTRAPQGCQAPAPCFQRQGTAGKVAF